MEIALILLVVAGFVAFTVIGNFAKFPDPLLAGLFGAGVVVGVALSEGRFLDAFGWAKGHFKTIYDIALEKFHIDTVTEATGSGKPTVNDLLKSSGYAAGIFIGLAFAYKFLKYVLAVVVGIVVGLMVVRPTLRHLGYQVGGL